MPHNVHIIVYKSEETWLLTSFTHPMSPCTYQGCSYQPWTPFLLASPPLIKSECQHSTYLTNCHYDDGVLYILPEKKRTVGMKHIALFPSIYLQRHGTHLGYPPVEMATKAAYASPTRPKHRGMKHRASFLSAYFWESMGYLPGLLQGILSCRSM